MSQKQVYRKKGETTQQEESKEGHQQQQRQEDSGFRGGRGSRGNRGGYQHRGDYRGGKPQTSYGDRKPYYQKKGEDNQVKEETKGDDQKQGDRRGNGRHQEVDENTYYYKYFYGPRPKYQKVNVTAETEVPTVPPKDQRKKQPDQSEFDKKMRELDNQIETLRNKIRTIGQKKKEVQEGGRVGNTNITYKDFLKEKIEAVNEIRAEKRKYVDQIRKVQEKIDQLTLQRQSLFKSLHKEYKEPAKIQNAIEELQKRYETTTLKSSQEEKKVMNDIKFLKATLPSAEQLEEIKPQIDKLYTEKKGIKEKLDEFSADIEGRDEEINKVKKEMEDAREQKQDIKQQLDSYEEQIQKVKDDLQNLYAKKNEIREEYFKAKLEFELERDEVYHSEWIVKEKNKLEERDKLKKERIEARKQALLDRPNPYQKEIDICEHLIAYCQKLKVITGIALAPADEQIKQEQKQIMTQLNKEDVTKKLQDGKLERVKTKKEREDEALIKVGGKRKKDKKTKAKDFDIEDPFKIDIALIHEFGFLKVSPPLNKESLDTKITELEGKLSHYVKDGEAKLKEEEEKLGEGLLGDEEEEQHHEEERDSERFRGGRGGRGGFRGGRGGFRGGDRDRPQTEGGRGRGGKFRQNRDEQEQYDEDDGQQYTEIIHNKHGRRTNKKEDLALNDNNYPDLS